MALWVELSVCAVIFQTPYQRAQACGADFIATKKEGVKKFKCDTYTLLLSSACFCGWIDIIKAILSTEQHEYEFEIDVDRRSCRSSRQDRCGIGRKGRRRTPFLGIRACQACSRRHGWQPNKRCLWPWGEGKGCPEIP